MLCLDGAAKRALLIVLVEVNIGYIWHYTEQSLRMVAVFEWFIERLVWVEWNIFHNSEWIKYGWRMLFYQMVGSWFYIVIQHSVWWDYEL